MDGLSELKARCCGIEWDPGIVVRDFNTVRGVCSDRDVASNQLLMSIPSSVILSSSRLRNAIAKIVNAGDGDGEIQTALASPHHSLWWSPLALCLLLGRWIVESEDANDGQDNDTIAQTRAGLALLGLTDHFPELSALILYMRLIPAKFDTPLNWSSADVALMRCERSTERVEDLHNLLLRFTTDVAQPLLSRMIAVLTTSTVPKKNRRSLYTSNAYFLSEPEIVWAYSAVNSRTFHCDGDDLMVPCADLFNHSSHSPNIRFDILPTPSAAETDAEVESSLDSVDRFSFQIYSAKAVPAQHQLVLSYGTHSNYDLVHQFGFTLPLDENSLWKLPLAYNHTILCEELQQCSSLVLKAVELKSRPSQSNKTQTGGSRGGVEYLYYCSGKTDGSILSLLQSNVSKDSIVLITDNSDDLVCQLKPRTYSVLCVADIEGLLALQGMLIAEIEEHLFAVHDDANGGSYGEHSDQNSHSALAISFRASQSRALEIALSCLHSDRYAMSSR